MSNLHSYDLKCQVNQIQTICCFGFEKKLLELVESICARQVKQPNLSTELIEYHPPVLVTMVLYVTLINVVVDKFFTVSPWAN